MGETFADRTTRPCLPRVPRRSEIVLPHLSQGKQILQLLPWRTRASSRGNCVCMRLCDVMFWLY